MTVITSTGISILNDLDILRIYPLTNNSYSSRLTLSDITSTQRQVFELQSMAQIDPRLLGLTSANRGGQTSRQRKSLATYQKFRETLGHKTNITKFGTGNFIEDTIILDIGSRYSKVGFVNEPGPRRICKTHLRFGDERKSEPYSSQKFKACVTLKPVALSLSKTPQSPQTWQEITELLVNDLLFTFVVLSVQYILAHNTYIHNISAF